MDSVPLLLDILKIRFLVLLVFVSFCIWCLGHSFLLASNESMPVGSVIYSTEHNLIYSFNALSSFGYCTIWVAVIHLFIYLPRTKVKLGFKVLMLLTILLLLLLFFLYCLVTIFLLNTLSLYLVGEIPLIQILFSSGSIVLFL